MSERLRPWDAAAYDVVAEPQTRWGIEVLARLALRGDEMVLDAGCGTGRVIETLAPRLPRGRVVALDGAPGMASKARARLAPHRIFDVVVADLRAPLPFRAASFDAVVSTATFHWVSDHEALFESLARVLRPGGALVAQCGGRGNLASVNRAVEEMGLPGENKHYAGAEETEGRLRAAGFERVRTWLTTMPTPFASRASLEAFLAAVPCGTHVDRLPAGERERLVGEIADRIGGTTLDYVRLNIEAVRA